MVRTPVSPTSVVLTDAQVLKRWVLPGRDRSGHESCSRWATYGHSIERSNVELPPPGEWHARRRKLSCRAFGCPEDVAPQGRRWANRWASREAWAIRLRIGDKCTHAVVSPPGHEGSQLDLNGELLEPGSRSAPGSPAAFRRLRNRAYEIAWMTGIQRGAWVPHVGRGIGSDRDLEGCRDGLHWHVLTNDWVDINTVAALFLETGWVVKVIGRRRTMRVALYELHHSARVEGYPANTANSSVRTDDEPRLLTEAVTWTGTWKSTPKDPGEGIWCSLCVRWVPASEWRELIRILPSSPGPPARGIVELDKSAWSAVRHEFRSTEWRLGAVG